MWAMLSDQDNYFDLKALAAYSSLAVPTLREYLAGSDGIPHYKLRGKILVRRSEFDKWLQGFRVDPRAEMRRVVQDVMESLR
jgi:hypothetical protein